MIHVDKLRKDYLQKRKTITAVDSISFEVQKGEFFFIAWS